MPDDDRGVVQVFGIRRERLLPLVACGVVRRWEIRDCDFPASLFKPILQPRKPMFFPRAGNIVDNETGFWLYALHHMDDRQAKGAGERKVPALMRPKRQYCPRSHPC